MAQDHLRLVDEQGQDVHEQGQDVHEQGQDVHEQDADKQYPVDSCSMIL
jgi:hypothetical protein